MINEATTQILLIIELDDRTHDRKDRRERDAFVDMAFQAAGIQILHVPAASKYNLGELRATVISRLAAIR